MSDALTVDTIRQAMERFAAAPYRPCSHVVSPKYQGWRIALTREETAAVVRCAACFAYVCLARPEAANV